MITYLLHGTESFLRSELILQVVKIFSAFLEPEGSFPVLKCPPPVPILSQLHPVLTTPFHFLNIHLNIILPSASGSPQWSLSLRCSHQNPVHPSPLPRLYMITWYILEVPRVPGDKRTVCVRVCVCVCVCVYCRK